MGKLGKETKNLLLAITVICLISFLLAAGLSFLLAKDFQHEMLLHDYGVSGYQLNHEDKLQISAFTAHPNESDIERGKEALASIGYSEATSMQLLPTVREYRNQTMLYLFLLLLFLFGMVYLVLLFYLRRQHRAIDDAGSKIREFLDGNSMSRIECSQTGDWYSLFHDVNEMATILSAHAESQKQTKEFLQDIISDVSHQIKTPLSALKMYHEIISSHKGEAETVANFSEKSQREIKRMENVIYTLLKLARLDAGIIQMEKAEENVSALMQDVLERFETWAEQDHKEITLSGKDDISLNCDALWMSEAIGNIVKNALEHTQPGGHISVQWTQSPLLTQIVITDDMPIFGISWLSIGVSIVLGLITVLLAARTPAKMAAKVSPLEAVTGNTQQESSFRHAANTRRWHVEVALGIHHAKAKRRSYILMTGAFAICITLFLGFCTLVPFMENAFMPKEWSPELSIVSDTNTCSIPADRRDAVVQNSAVSRVFGRMLAYDVPAQISGAIHNSNLISYEENQFRWAQDQLIAGSIDTVTNTPGQVLFVANTGTEVQVGDTITLTINGKDQTVTVGGVLSDSLLARAEGTETLICSEETFSQLTGETGYTILDVQFRFGSDEEDVAEVEALFGEGVTFTDVLIQAQQQRGLYYAFATLVYGFLSIIVAITIFHIVNTISMGVSARTRQYGVMRAIGMSNQQLTRMISAEAASYAISGVILGCIFGLLFHWFLYSSLITRTFGNPWSVPWLELCLIIGVILATTALAVRGPARRLHAMSILELMK